MFKMVISNPLSFFAVFSSLINLKSLTFLVMFKIMVSSPLSFFAVFSN